LNVYAKCNTLTDGSGWKEIDLNMSPDPALQIVTSKIKSLGEVFITTCPVSIALDGKKPVVEDIEMTEENKPENEEKEKEKEGNFLLVLSSFMYPFFPHTLVSVVVCLFASCFFISSSETSYVPLKHGLSLSRLCGSSFKIWKKKECS
jgi:hypothetical protein